MSTILESATDQHDDAPVGFRADESARRLNHTGHSRDQEGIRKTVAVGFLEILLEELAFGVELWESRRNYHNLRKHLARIVDAFGKYSTEDRQDQVGATPAQPFQNLMLDVVAGAGSLDDDFVLVWIHSVVYGGEIGVAGKQDKGISSGRRQAIDP